MIEFRLLGSLEVVEDDRLLVLGAPRQRALLAVLLVSRGEPVSSDRLIEELWGERPPATAIKVVQGYVSNLRKVLGEGMVVTRGRGYLLNTVPGQTDLDRFEALVEDGRRALYSGDARAAATQLQQALALWRGAPLAEFAYESFAQPEIARLDEARLAAVEDRLDAELALGEHRRLVGELEALVREHPRRERLVGQLMLALYRSGRQAEALETYRATRRRLTEELGLEPGRALQELEQAILEQDPALDPPARATGPASGLAARASRRGRWLLAAGGLVLLLAVIAAGIGELAGGRSLSVRVAPNSVAVIDVGSDRVVAAVPVGSSPASVVSGAGALWVANVADQTVSRIDPARLRVVGTMTLGATPTGLAASADAVWVVQSSAGASFVSLRRIDPEFNALGPALRLSNVDTGSPGSVAVDGSAVWVAPASGLLTRVDSRTGRIARQVDPNASPAGIGVGHGAVWVTDSDADTVTRVDPDGLLTPITVGNGPDAIAVGADGVWVADTMDDAVTRIDPSSEAVMTTIPVGRSPSAVAIGAGSVWVANGGDGTVTRIDPRTDKVVSTIDVGGSPQGITIANGRAWVTVGAAPVPARPAASGGTLRVETLGGVDYLDPALAYAPASWQLLYATCAKLLNYPDRSGSAGGQLTPEIARSLPARSADGRTYTFTIRTGFRFSPPSNQPVTAQTLKDTIERTLNPRTGSPIGYEFTDIVGASAYMAGKAAHIAGVAVRGDTLTIRLLAPDAELPSLLAQPFFCAVPSDTPVSRAGVPVIPSAGPYYVASYTPGQAVVLARNPNYRGGRPHRLDRIDVTLGVSSNRAIADIEAGSADYTTIGGTPSANAVALRLAARYGPGTAAARRDAQQYFATQMPGLDFFVLNTHRPLFSEVRLRRAVNYAINRRALARFGDGYVGSDRPTSQYLPPGVPGSSNTQTYPLTPDVPKARDLARGRDRIAVLYACDYPACLQLAQIAKNDLRAIGLHVHVKLFDHATLGAQLARPNAPFDLALGTWLPDYPDPGAMLSGMLENSSIYPTFTDPAYRRRLASAEQLSGPRRYLAFGQLARDLATQAAPLIAYGNSIEQELFSPRIGCQTHSFYNGVDLAALCIRHQHDPHSPSTSTTG